MSFSEHLPWRRRSASVAREEHPILSLQDQMNRVFDGFFSGFAPELFGKFGGGDLGVFTPNINISEDQKEIRVTAELPGIDEKDVEISLTPKYLTLRGEKRFEQEEKREGRVVHVERSFGSFQRAIPLSAEILEDKVDASFKKGVLTVVLPKKEGASGMKKISIRNG